MISVEDVRREVDAERWLVARLVAALLDTRGEVTSTEIVDAWERIGVSWTDRRAAFSRVQRELHRMWSDGDLCSDELRQVTPGGPPRRVYRRPS